MASCRRCGDGDATGAGEAAGAALHAVHDVVQLRPLQAISADEAGESARVEEARARLDALVETSDGFIIAQRDLDIRGPGELFGAKQSGIAPFRVAQLPDDLELLQLARRDAAALVEQDPRLTDPKHSLLKRRLLKAHGKALGLGDVA